MSGKDTKARYQGVFARHQKDCAINAGKRCTCKPSYYGVVWDRARKRHVKTKRMPTIEAARNARSDLSGRVERGELPDGGGMPMSDARARFVSAAREGRALNKHGRRYKPRAVDDIEEVLRVHVEPTLGIKRISTIRRSHVQALVDELAPELSGSRVRSIVNGLRSLYRWAQDREVTSHDPAALVRLPAMDATPIERVASPAEFARLLAALEPQDALPYGWPGSRWDAGRRSCACDGQKSTSRSALSNGASSGRPASTRPPGGWSRSFRRCSCCSNAFTSSRAVRRRGSCARLTQTGPELASSNTGWLAKRVSKIWTEAELQPITLQEARHTAATWLDAAGVPPKIASVLMGHATPERQPGAAQITLARYTHALPEDVERARAKLAAYLAEAQQAEAAGQ